MASRVVDRYRSARKKWAQRIADIDRISDARCCGCNERAPPEPTLSRYSDTGLLIQTWTCVACGNQWITSSGATS